MSLDAHRKSGNEIEEGNETKHVLDQAYTKDRHSEVKSRVSLRTAKKKPYHFELRRDAHKDLKALASHSESE